MKSKELIKILQDLDPTGEIEVVADGVDIYIGSKLPMYYDGIPWLLIKNEAKKPFFHIDGMKFTNQGDKINLQTVSISDLLIDENDDDLFIFDLSQIEESRRKVAQLKINKLREERRQLDKEIEEENGKTSSTI